MKSDSYWMIFWQIKNLVYGEVLNTDIRLFSGNPDKLIKKASEKIRKNNDFFIYNTDVPEEYRMKILSVKTFPSDWGKNRKYRFPDAEFIDTVIIYGKKPSNHGFICHIPWFNMEFTYFDTEEPDFAAASQISEMLMHSDYDTFYNYTMLSAPELRKFSIKAEKEKKKRSSSVFVPEIINADLFPSQQANFRKSMMPRSAWERQGLIRISAEKLLKERANIIFTGESGTGKSIIIENIARLIAEERSAKTSSHSNLENLFWVTNPYRMVSGAKYFGDWQEICEKMMEDLEYYNGILYIQDIIGLLQGSEGSAHSSIASYLIFFLKRGKIRIIGEMSPGELERAYRLLPGFTGLFQIIPVDEMNDSSVMYVMNNYVNYIKKYTNVSFDRDSLNLSFRLLKKYILGEKFPGKAVRFLKTAAVKACKLKIPEIKPDFINRVFSEKTGLPEIMFQDSMPFSENQVQNYFSKRVIGQKEAGAVFASLISTYKAGLNNPGKPIGTVLLAGPSGTGKTTSAKVLAEFMFGSSGRLNTLFRLDMSELQSGYQLSRILGSSSEPGILIQHIRNNPFSVILLDEIEKAHPAFFDVIMTLLDEGILSDWSGREVNFRSCIIIMTSNLGSSSAPSIGLEPAETDYMKSIRNHFRPEFLNRIDHIIMFHPLDSDSVKTIASIELEKLKTMEKIQDRKIRLKFSESLIDWVSRIGVHPKFGARPLQRTIDQKIVPVLSRYLLQNPEQSDFQLLISLTDGKVTVEEHSSA